MTLDNIYKFRQKICNYSDIHKNKHFFSTKYSMVFCELLREFFKIHELKMPRFNDSRDPFE